MTDEERRLKFNADAFKANVREFNYAAAMTRIALAEERNKQDQKK